MSAKTRQKEQEEKAERLQSILLDPAFQEHCQNILSREFPRYNHGLQLDKDQVTMMLLSRDAAERFIESLYTGAGHVRPRSIPSHKRLIRTP